MKNLVSVIVPAYNIEKYITKCIDSITSQTYRNLEIIIVNDGSNDKTGNIIKEKAEEDKRIKYIVQKNTGLSASRNKGIKDAKGDYIVFIDGDDAIEKTFIEKLVLIIEKEKSDIAVCSFNTISSEEKTTERSYDKTTSGEEAVIQLLTKQDNIDIVAWNKLYKKELFLKNKIFYPEGEIHEDTLTTYKLYSKAKKVTYIKEPLYNYFKRFGSITSSVKLETSLNYKLRASKDAQEYFKSNNKLKDAAEIAELLSHYSFIDAMLTKKIPYDKEHIEWIRNNKGHLFKNQFLTKKLRLYIQMTSLNNAFLYRIYRKITL